MDLFQRSDMIVDWISGECVTLDQWRMDLCQKSDMSVDWTSGEWVSFEGGLVMGSNMIWKFILLDIGDCILDQWRMDLFQKSGMIVD